METPTQVLANEEASATAGSAAKLIREVRVKTRRQFSAEDKICIVLERFRKEVPVSDLCRREGISSALYYSRPKDFMEAGNAVSRETVCGMLRRAKSRSSGQRMVGLRSWWASRRCRFSC